MNLNEMNVLLFVDLKIGRKQKDFKKFNFLLVLFYKRYTVDFENKILNQTKSTQILMKKIALKLDS